MSELSTPEATTSTTAPFTEEEYQEFAQSDIDGGRIIVGLMTAIFFMGLILYIVIAYITGT